MRGNPTLSTAFDAYRDLVVEAEPALTALDERSGDGDFGANLRGGVLAAADALNAKERTWGTLARVFLDDVGGTSGPLFGLLFQNLDEAANAGDDVVEVVRTGSLHGLHAIQRVGEAAVGDRTLVDALAPAVEALWTGGDLSAALDAAVNGAIGTRDIVARRGRASYVGERAIGYPDPGAVGVALLFAAFAVASGADASAARVRLAAAVDGVVEPPVATRTSAVSADVEAVLAAAAAAQRAAAAIGAPQRARLLDALAEELETHAAELVAIAVDETHLPAARLESEVVRTAFQLRLFAEVVRSGDHLDVRIDEPDPSWPPAPRPDLRRVNRPIGPVLVFAGSNFPFAFSVLGGDTASALAAGNAVVVKAHPGHPLLSRRVAELATLRLESLGAPTGILSIIAGQENGLTAIKDRRIKAASFTGSIAAGLLLQRAAQQRLEPIPFFGELGSSNPVFVTPAADAADADEIVDGFVGSFTLGVGQFCTKPGIVFVPAGSAVLAALRTRTLPSCAEMLNDQIRDGYAGRLRVLIAAPGVEIVRSEGDAFAALPAPVVLTARGVDVLADPNLYLDECFGPSALIVEYDSWDQALQLAQRLDGQLTATIFGTDSDQPVDLVDVLAERAGRVLWRQWPTGVAVTRAQQHGGPFPASTAPQTTSVGTAAIDRFTRPVAFQGFPLRLLPAELR